MIQKKIILPCLLILFYSCNPPELSKKQQIDELFNYCFQNQMYNGSVLVQKGQEIIYNKGFGYADFDAGIPNKKDSKYRIGSLTKPITAMTIFELVKEGKIDMQGKLSEYIPYTKGSRIENITVYQLITHTSGIKNYLRFINRDVFNTKIDVINLIKDLPLDFLPGIKYRYSNSNYFILGAIIESVTKKKYSEVLSEKVLIPAKMHNTGIGHKYFEPGLSMGYYKNLTGYHLSDTTDLSIPFSAGSIYSTVIDLSLFIDLIKDNSEKTESGRIWINDTILPFGLRAVRIDSMGTHGVTVLSHNGQINGYYARMAWIREDDIKIIMLVNNFNRSLNAISEKILAILYEKDYIMPKKYFADYLFDKYRGKELYPALEVSKEELENLIVNEFELMILGYDFLEKNENKNAEAIFRFITDIYPKSDNAVLCLGKIHESENRLDSAKYYYSKALEINPGNKEAKGLINRFQKQ